MKTRFSFVSNSSSSSFIVCGIQDIDENDKVIIIKEVLGDEVFYNHEDKIREIVEDAWDMWSIEYAFNKQGIPFDFGDLSFNFKEYYDRGFGVETDPTELDVNECIAGFVSPKDYEILLRVATLLDKDITTWGDCTYG